MLDKLKAFLLHFISSVKYKDLLWWLVYCFFAFFILKKRVEDVKTDNAYMLQFIMVTIAIQSFLFFYLIPKLVFRRKFLIATLFFIPIYLFVHIPNQVMLLKNELTTNSKDFATKNIIELEVVLVKLFDKYGVFATFKSGTFLFWIFSEFMLFNSPFLFFASFYYLFKIQRETFKGEMLSSKIEKEYLQQQINPHFLFNSLNNIYGLSLTKDQNAKPVTLMLKTLMKGFFRQSRIERVPLTEEVNLMLNMIELEKIRYRHGFKLSHNLEQDINKNLLICPFILNTFIENAFKHGVSANIENSFIDIKLEIQNQVLIFEVKNLIPKLQRTTDSGIGLKNTLRRIEIIYPTSNVQIRTEEGVFVVKLILNLDEKIR